jgi:hypothetical protein
MNSNALGISFEDLLRDKEKSQQFIHTLVEELRENGWWGWFLNEINRGSKHDEKSAFPDQGLIKTPYDGVDYNKIRIISLGEHNKELLEQTLKAWLYYLFLFNHPSRLEQLFITDQNDFVPPLGKKNAFFISAEENGHAVAITQLALAVDGSDKERTKRTERFCQGPFVKLGKQARAIFVGSANPEVFGSSAAIASLVQAHCLTAVPRDGYFANIERQAALAKNVFTWLRKSPLLNKIENEHSQKLLGLWLHNVMGVLEASPDKALRRARVLYDAGVRTFRVYSPEPGTGPLQTVSQLRSLEKKSGWEPIEIFAGQIVSVNQAE